MANLFFLIGILLFTATVLAIIARLLKQPYFLAYIITGILIGPMGLGFIADTETIDFMSELGIAFLLFIVGLELDVRKLKSLGFVSVISGLGQVFFTFLISFFLLNYLGAPVKTNFFISSAVVFSSTVIVIKLLSDKNELYSLHGRIALGILLVQDIIAIILLASLSDVMKSIPETILVTFIKLFFGIILLILLNKYVLSRLFGFFAKSQELLFLSTITWCFLFIILAKVLNLSLAIGALFAGVGLASLPYNLEIISKTKGLRDFFSIIFFISLGIQIVVYSVADIIFPVVFLSLFVMIGNPLIFTLVMSLLGFKPKTGFLTGISLAQISEFSLIIISYAHRLQMVSKEILSLITVVAAVTFATSSYYIMYSDKIYSRFSFILKFFEKLSLKKIKLGYRPKKDKKYDIVLFGANRIGKRILKKVLNYRKKIIVFDINPETIKKLMNKKIPCIYGDIGEISTIEELFAFRPKMVVSSVQNFNDNALLIKKVKQESGKIIILVTAQDAQDALKLYDEGADYVFVPHFIGGDYASNVVEESFKDMPSLLNRKLKELKELKKRQ